MDGKTLKRFSPAQILLAVAAFLIPVIGGQIQTEAQPLEPGFGALLKAMLGGPFLQGVETPLLSHFVIGLLIAAATIAVLVKRSVLQLPNVKLIGLMIGFFGMLVLSCGMSAFKLVSMATLSEWLIYALALFAVVAATGRQSGPRLVLSCLYAGVVLIAIYGIRFEYLPMSSTDPSYRIFAGWINPNATAGILFVGALLGFSIAVTSGPKPGEEGTDKSDMIAKLVRFLLHFCNLLILVALFLTGSKAGSAALALVGVPVYALLILFWRRPFQKALLPALLPIVLVVVAFFGYKLVVSHRAAVQGTNNANVERVTSYSSTADQSWTFRKLLWKGSVEIAVKNPVGYGLGTYRYEGSRPGLTTLTQLAHENLLQLLVEASPLAPLFAIAMFGFWLFLMFRGARNMPDEVNVLRAAIVAAVLAVLAQGFFESNLYYFGLGLTVFMLMGLGLNLSADSVIPEFTPKGARTAIALLASLPIVMIGYVGYAEWLRAQIKYEVDNRQTSDAAQLSESLVSAVPLDGEGWYVLSMLSPQRRDEAIHRAAELYPSPRVLRGLAVWNEQEKKYTSALDAIRQALIRDPNNLSALNIALRICQEMGDPDNAQDYAHRIVAVEATPYFQIRSLPEMVETGTCDARLFLAKDEKDPVKRADLLKGALDIFVQYAQTTVPVVKRYTAEGGTFAGENLEGAIDKCKRGLEIAKQLGDAPGVTDEAKTLQSALDSLNEPAKPQS